MRWAALGYDRLALGWYGMCFLICVSVLASVLEHIFLVDVRVGLMSREQYYSLEHHPKVKDGVQRCESDAGGQQERHHSTNAGLRFHVSVFNSRNNSPAA